MGKGTCHALRGEEESFDKKPPKVMGKTPMPAQKDGEGQEEENNEVRPPEQEEEEEVVEEGAQPRRPSLTVLCHAVASALHPTARRLIFRLCDRAPATDGGERFGRQ